jgi:transcriptional regulator with XRE-family HTH domain
LCSYAIIVRANLSYVNSGRTMLATEPVSALGERLTVLRKRLKLRQADLAERVGVSRMTVSAWERGEAVPASENLGKLAQVLQVDPQALHDAVSGDRTEITLTYAGENGEAFSVPTSFREHPAQWLRGRDRRLTPRVYESVYGYLERMRQKGCSEEQIAEAERIMTDAAYSQLLTQPRRELDDDDRIVLIHGAWKWIAEVIEQTEGKKL